MQPTHVTIQWSDQNKRGRGWDGHGGAGAGARVGNIVRAASGTGYSGTGVLYAPLGNYSRGSYSLPRMLQRHAATEGISCQL